MQYSQTQQVQLPVSPDHIDQSTFNPNLPNGNDVWPPLSRQPQMDGQVIGACVAQFRMFAQSRAGKTRVHTFTYNMLSSNRFQNPIMAEWCQRAVDFCEFLIRVQNNQPMVAAEKAAAKIYLGLLYTMVATPQFAVLQQMIDQNTATGLNQAGAELQAITNDVQNWLRSGTQQQSPYGTGGVSIGGAQQLPPIGGGATYGAASGHNPHAALSSYNSPAPASGVANTDHLMPMPPVAPATGVTVDGDRSGRYIDGSVKSWGGAAPAQTIISQQQPAPVPEFNEPIPGNVNEVIVDPGMNVRLGYEVNPDRPFDVIHNAGGIEIRPAYQTKWKRTVGDDQPYALLVDPAKWIVFYVRFPDGVVKEKLVEIEDGMQYLQHEISDKLRAAAFKPEGKVVQSSREIAEYNALPVPITEVDQRQDQELDDITPVILPAVFTCSTDLENEREARLTVIEALKLDPTDVLPAHQYTSVKFHSMDISQECYSALLEFAEHTNWETVADHLSRLGRTGLLPMRYYRFINERLTQAVNLFLTDSLSITGIRISDFSDDIAALPAYLGKKRGLEIQQVFDRSVENIVKRAVCMANEGEDDNTAYGIVDQYINLQLSWSQDQIATLAIEKEPVLVSEASHPKVLEVIKDLLVRVGQDDDKLRTHTLRLLTVDGCYYEVIRGRLMQHAILLKRAA
jgi:hypothetical protein